MIQLRTILRVADNSGARRVQCIKVFNAGNSRYARIGDMITASVREAEPHGLIKKGDKVQAVIVRTKHPISRPDGTYLRFSENACVVVDKAKKEPKGTRVFGPVAREVKKRGFMKIASLAPEVL
jgi:large subunit ribosomal protein L14